jgi:Fe-S cluster assembly protein SufD
MNAFVRSQLDAATPLAQHSLGWLHELREAARHAVEASGLPGPRDEAWKYTQLKALQSLSPAVGDPDAGERAVALDGLLLDGLSGPRLVFLNGTFRPDLSRLAGLPTGVDLRPLAAVLDREPESARVAFASGDDEHGVGLAQLNTALASDGVWLHIAPGTPVEQPIHLVFAGAETGSALAWHLRHAITLGAGASATVVEQHVGVAESAQFGNIVESLHIGTGASLRHLRLQQSPLAATLVSRSTVRLAVDSVFESVALELGAGLSRRDVEVLLEGSGARLDARGATALRGRQHADSHYEVRHIARDTRCDVRWRGIADERARAVFGGTIVVEVGADGSDARLSNKNLLLSPHAEIDTRPVLEIHADEVEAAHGATVGRLDDNALFYLRSRGVPEVQARTMLTYAFCADVLSGVEPESLRAQLGARLAAHLPQQPAVDA